MAQANDRDDQDIQQLLAKLADVPARDPQAQAKELTHFIEQARMIAQDKSRSEKTNRVWGNPYFFERIIKIMKFMTKFSTIMVVIVAAVITTFVLAQNATSVSAQQILTRAMEAQAVPAQGIWHTRIQIYQNHTMLPGDHAGLTTTDESYFDLATGRYRFVTKDSAGKIVEIGADDGTYSYIGLQKGTSSNALKVTRTRLDPSREKKVRTSDVTASATALFDDFKNNPRVKVAEQKTWTDGTPVYVLIDDNTQTRKTGEQTFTGSMRMVFNAKTYQLVESQTTVRKAGQDVIIDEVQWLVNEVLPADSSVAWDLSDLKGIAITDESNPVSQNPVKFETMTEQMLATRTKNFYVLKPLPADYAMTIIAVTDQPKNQDYQFEINYARSDGETLGLQAVGIMDAGFVASSFYDGSYKAASGLEVHYSPSHPNGGTSAMLVDPEGNGFLLTSSLPREKVQALVETLVKGL